MLASLRFDGFVGGNHQKEEIHAGGAREHVADETLVARNIDKAEANAAFFEKCEPKIDGDPATLFFLEAVRMGASESLDERGLAMVDVAGGADDYAFWIHARVRMTCSKRLQCHSGVHIQIRINEQWRICFIWRDGHPYEVEIVDYH